MLLAPQTACEYLAVTVSSILIFKWLDNSTFSRWYSAMASRVRPSIALVFAALVKLLVPAAQWCLKLIAASLRVCATIYLVFRIVLALTAYVIIQFNKWLTRLAKLIFAYLFDLEGLLIYKQKTRLKQAHTLTDWTKLKTRLDELASKSHEKSATDEATPCDLEQIKRDHESLSMALATHNVASVKCLLTSLVARNKSGIDAAELHVGHCDSNAKQIIDSYQALVIRGLEFLANAKADEFAPHEKLQYFQKLKRAFGNTGLCLSGGGSISMYHMGVVRALIKANVLPNVISGSSGGSIVAGLLATRTNDELLSNVFVNDISIRYIRHGIQWFPPILQQLRSLLATGSLVICSDFVRTTQQYYGEPLDSFDKTMHYTFEDAFLKTGRHVCIAVSAASVGSIVKGPKKLMLSHVTTPHVLVWSAVAVSCSLPGIMKAKQLMARDQEGNVVPYDALGKEWIDGSIQHDLPMKTMASCFNVTKFIVSQVNPRVVPLVGDDVDDPTVKKSWFYTLEKLTLADVSHAVKLLSLLGFNRFSSQETTGDVTLVPDLTFLEAIGAKLIMNPSREDMDRYLLGGKRSVWPKLAYTSHLCAIEKCLERVLSQIESAADCSKIPKP